MLDGQASTRWERIKLLFGDARQLSGQQRADYLRDAAGDDSGLRREVESLLEHADRDEGPRAGPTLGEPPSTASRPPPERIGRYRILARLGSGGMGEVHLAHDTQLDRRVALKLLPVEDEARSTQRARLLREARAAAGLNHANIATIHEIGEADGRDYIALEFVEGRSLHAVLAERRLPLAEILAIAIPLADALSYAHGRGVVHRDVKAANVMLAPGSVPKLVDFGLAKIVPAALTAERGEATDTLSIDGAILGTPGAMSPEQALGQSVDHRSDVFSFGSLLYEMAAGRPAFRGGSALGTIGAVVHAEPEPLAALRPDLPAAFIEIVARALRKRPGERFADMAACAAALRGLDPSRGPGRTGPSRSRRRLALVSAAAVALAAATAYVVYWRGQPAAAPSAAQAAPAPAHRLALVDFENLADPQDGDRFAAMLDLLLVTELSAGTGVELLSEQRLLDVARQLGHQVRRLDTDIASDVAVRAGAGTLLRGSVGRMGETCVASLELVDLATGRTRGAPRAEGRGEQAVFDMARSLARQVRVLLQAPDATESEREAIDRQLTTSLEAWRAYVRGEQALRGGDVALAAREFEQAADLDPGFALAHYRHAVALIWTGDDERGRQAKERALAFIDRLPERLGRLLTDLRPHLLSDHNAPMLSILLEFLEADPYDSDVLHMLGEIYTHSATHNDAARAADIYERLLAIDPQLSLVYEHQFNAWLRQGRLDAIRERLPAWRAVAPELVDGLQDTLALWEGRLDERRTRVGERLDLVLLADEHGALEARLPRARSAAEIEASLGDVQGVYRILELDLHANALVLQGRLQDAAVLYDRAVQIRPEIWSADGFISSLRNGCRQRRALLLQLQGDRAGARALVEAALAVQPESYRCLYFAARFALADGDRAAAEAHHERLAELTARGLSPTASFYRDAVGAERALADGAFDAAREGFGALLASRAAWLDWYVHEDVLAPLLREGLARACQGAGDAAGADAAWAALLEAGYERLRHPVPWVSALASRGMLAAERGRPDEARALLTHFLEHWGGADGPPPLVARARALLDD